MTKRLLCMFCLAFLCPGISSAADTGSLTTVIRLEERDFPGIGKKTIMPATEFVKLDSDNLYDGRLSFHLYGWGRLDLADKSSSDGTVDGNLTYGYLVYRLPNADAQVKAGRFFLYEGVANEQIDGISARSDLFKDLTLSLFTGIPVSLDRKNDNKGNYIIGGRGAYRWKGRLEVGLSTLHESDVNTGILPELKRYREMTGADIWAIPYKDVEVNGHTYYNNATGGVAEHSFLLAYVPAKELLVSAEYDRQNFKHYFASTNLVTLTSPLANPNTPFNPNAVGGSSSYGLNAVYSLSKPLEIRADLSRLTRDREGNAYRFGIDTKLTLMDKKWRSGGGYHRVDSSGNINSYHELRGYSMFDPGTYFCSLDAIGVFYDKSIFKESQALDFTLSSGYRLRDNIILGGDLAYSSNPYYTRQLHLLFKLTYNFTLPGKGGNK